jgi:hypothetical protein
MCWHSFMAGVVTQTVVACLLLCVVRRIKGE